eukprot:symbB.v1.2.015725.t1/scaffold1184.1/size176679/5
MVLLRELEMQGQKVSDPTEWIQQAVQQAGGDHIDIAEELHGASAVEEKIAELNQSGQLAASIVTEEVKDGLDRLPEEDALGLLQEVLGRGRSVKNPTAFIRFKLKARLAVLGVSLDTPMDEHSKILKTVFRFKPRFGSSWHQQAMFRLFSGLAAGGLVAAQDPASMATAMAGQVAGIMASKAEKMVENRLEHPPETVPCIGDSCCLGSTCMNLPGLGCKASRGRTQCVGSSALAMKEGVCQCLRGPCNEEGICVSTLPPEQQKDFLPPSPPPEIMRDMSHGDATGSSSGGGIPVVPIAIALVLANVVIWGAIWCIKQKRNRDYNNSFSSDDEDVPMAYKGGNNRRFQGPVYICLHADTAGK